MTFLERMWAYVTLGAMAIVWEEASPLLGGLAAFERRLDLLSVIGAVAFGTWVASLLLYLFGRARGRWLRKRWPRVRPLIVRSVAIVRRHPWRVSIAARFAFGIRVVLPVACGMGRVPILVYSVGTAVSCALWSLTFTLLGWGLGRTTESFLGHVRRFEPLVGASVVLLMLFGFIILRRRHVAERTAEILDAEP